MIFMSFFTVLFLFVLVKVVHNRNIVKQRDLRIDQGKLRGYQYENKNYLEFLGIPYAAAPVGINRFKAPLPPPNWSGIFHANKTVTCAQGNITNEDCLVVNIYVPNKETDSTFPNSSIDETLPVLVYIHGGAFFVGAGIETSNVKHLIDQDVIVVTFNYRLGALGFLCLGIDEAPGNTGLKDQITALMWVKRNIKMFGGNPDNVTIAGTSAGGTSVELLIISPLSKGLFRNGIIESGSAATVWAIDATPIITAEKVAVAMGYEGKNSLKDLAEFYLKVDVKTLNKYTEEEFATRTDGTFGFVPCIENSSGDTFLTEHPLDIIREDKFEHLQILYIFVNGEGFFRESNFYDYKDRMNENFFEFLPGNLYFENLKQKYEVANKTKFFYFGNRNVSDNTVVEYFNYFGDILFIYPIINSSLNMAATNSKSVYMLEFCYEGGLNQPKEYFKHIPMAGHVDSSNYVFALDNVSGKDRDVVDVMVGIWTNFIKSGSPNYPKWLPVTKETVNYLQVNKTNKILTNPYSDRMNFLDSLYINYRNNLKRPNSW